MSSSFIYSAASSNREMDAFSGFGSPVASQNGFMTVQTPGDKTKSAGLLIDNNSQSPLLFRRTPGIANDATPVADSSRRYSDWVMSTSPYAGQKTPPTVSMMSVRADENTPPHLQDTAAAAGPCGSSQHFQAWLRATGSTKWTPRHSPSAGTPPPAPAPTPAGTPMSTSGLPASAVSPATAEPRSRPLFDLGPCASDSESDTGEDDEAATTVGASELAAAAARMRTALAAAAAAGAAAGAGLPAGSSAGGCLSFMPPRVPANTPECCSSPSLSPGSNSLGKPQQHAQQRLNGQLGDSLATPLSQLSVARAPGTHGTAEDFDGFGSQQHSARAPGAMWPQVTPGRSSHSQAPPASPVVKVIGLMMQPGAGHDHHQHGHQHGPSRLVPPPSPEQQVIKLMMQQQEVEGLEEQLQQGGTAWLAQCNQEEQQQAAAAMGAAVGAEQQQLLQHGSDSDADDVFFSGSEHGSSSSQSDDDIDVAELQQLCGAGAGHGTPIDDIIGMLLTPELKGTSFTPLFAAAATAGQEEQHGDGVVAPRVLFGDDEH